MVNNKKISKFFIISLTLILIISVITSNVEKNGLKKGAKNLLCVESNTEVVIADKLISVCIADSTDERTNGLSGIKTLAENEGLLLIFDSSDLHGIWMREMNFPIDILWLGEDLEVVGIENNVSPNTFPKVYLPKYPARFVLEINANFLSDTGVKIGDKVQIFTHK